MNTRQIMRKYGIRADKSLGQHFLVEEEPIYAMLEAADIGEEDGVLEIGPGLGVLTTALAQRAKKVVAVEKDRDLLPILEKVTKNYKNICIIQDDVLKLDMARLRDDCFGANFKVVANLPYYITSPIIMKIVEYRHIIPAAVLMVQREVGLRLSASPGTKAYGILSIAVQLYADVSFVCDVPRDYFEPAPKVESAVVKLSLLPEPRIPLVDEALFFRVVEGAFGQRRKNIKNALKRSTISGIGAEGIDEALRLSDINSTRRGETLTLEEFARLTEEVYRLFKS